MSVVVEQTEPTTRELQSDSSPASGFDRLLRQSLPGIGKYVLLSVLTAMVIIPFLIGPTTSQRDQSALSSELAERFTQAAAAAGTADLSPLPSQAFAQGSPVALIEIPKLAIQYVVIEGTSSSDTARAIGHMFGTSGLGQEGNSVLVGRSAAFGAPFKDLKSLETGDLISVSTIQGQTEYAVDKALEPPLDGPLGATSDNRLTLVTGDPPLLSSSMFTVSAVLTGKPYVDYPQNPSWLATHPLGDDKFPLAELILVLVVIVAVGVGFRIARVYFSTVTVYAIFFPIFLAQSVLVARVVFEFLPPVL